MSFSNFHKLDPSVRDVASGLLADADRNHPPSFMSFTYRWMAFNGWMSCVTLEDQDWKIINAIAAEPRLEQAHADLMAADPYRENVQRFASLWPILNVRDVRKKLGFDAFRKHSRAELMAAGVRHQPEAWLPGAEPTWDQVIRAIYQVRCNLFHGEKSPEAVRDRRLVIAADTILGSFISETHCLDWMDL